MKTLVVYYSFEGNTKFIAETIAATVNADILELKVKSDPQSKNFLKYVWGGRQVISRKKPALLPYDKKPENYDLIYIGTPVWAFTFAPAIRTLLTSAKFQNKKLALFCCHSGGAGKTIENMKEFLGGNTILGESDYIDPLKYKESTSIKAREWAKNIIGIQ